MASVPFRRAVVRAIRNATEGVPYEYRVINRLEVKPSIPPLPNPSPARGEDFGP